MADQEAQEQAEQSTSDSQVAGSHFALGQSLREARMYLGLSQEFVADQLGVPRASVSAMESGKRKVSGLEIKQLAALYKRPVTFFLNTDDKEMDLEAAMPDETSRALFRAARNLSSEDREQVLRFAQFLRRAGKAPIPQSDPTES